MFEHESQTCTDVLQKCNQPRAKKVNLIPVDELGSRRRELTKPTRTTNVVYDPRPLSLRHGSTTALEQLRCDLINLPQQCALTNILIPSVEKIQLDHSYTTLTDQDKPLEPPINCSDVTNLLLSCPYSDEEKQEKGEEIIEELALTKIETEELGKKDKVSIKRSIVV